MYINTKTGNYPCTESDIRAAAYPAVLPAVLTDEHLNHLGYADVKIVEVPKSDFFQFKELAPVEYDGLYQQAWAIDDGGMTLEQHKERAVAILSSLFEAKAETLSGHYPLFEKQTWEMQRDEAFAYRSWLESGSDTEARPETPTLDTLCQYRGDTVEELHSKVIDNDANWITAARHLSGARQRVEREIRDTKTLEEINEKLAQAKAFSL